jgi:hypothetical protein
MSASAYHKFFQVELTNLLDNQHSGLHSVFTYSDCEYVTAYAEQTKTEFYLHKDEFKKNFKKVKT